MTGEARLTSAAPGTFVVEVDGTRQIVYVAGTAEDQWAFWNGRIFRSESPTAPPTSRSAAARAVPAQQLSSPMPATVVRVLARPGLHVAKGDPVVILEAMKMELPVRSPSEGTITAVHCHEGELVQADQLLVELE